MRIFRNLPTAADTPVALTIGNFDGVHCGHQAMLARLVEAADDLGLTPAVMTFEPHPREFFAPATAPARLSTLRGKLVAFAAHRVARTYVARFNAALAGLSPQVFIDDVLVHRLGVRWLLIGEDFRFGKARAGDVAMLRAHARTFSVETMRNVVEGGERISSSVVRAALQNGDLDRAAALLGRPFRISGHVAHGQKLGRRLGFPTANIALPHAPPLTGIFAVRVHGLPGGPRTGAASLGVRPTVEDHAAPLLEVYILDFDEPIYGRRLHVDFLRKLRDEVRFPDVEAMRRQIDADVTDTRAFFAAARN